jgi:hypothetical protein
MYCAYCGDEDVDIRAGVKTELVGGGVNVEENDVCAGCWLELFKQGRII